MYQNLSEEEKNKKKNMVASDIRIFLKIKKKRNVSMKVNATKIFLKIKNSRKNSGIKEQQKIKKKFLFREKISHESLNKTSDLCNDPKTIE